jgi:hypothetical protein
MVALAPPQGPGIVLGPGTKMDHTSSACARRGGITDWGRVFQIEVDEDLYKEARSAGP